ncbi:hypothetical protein [Mycobacterium sp. 852014-52144_SCH5372336]|uniref:hypothetical protein n=1 Tax=Mycobacterium sp. 852014-52144_SCH5372336 TaxID=1834115 RepID=UPI0007FDF84E|nr:hypothetical protein [Mycobacterium sp. 852014-52144_SCH5372336]OBB74052.1 hypothetical protein A5759_12400 [Mycobacterium sp. 852014-52144_SCH5372336]
MRSLITTAATAVAALAALATATNASAVPEWDIGAYDQCWNSGIGQGFTQEEFDEHVHHCCVNSGGVWNAALEKCQSPPAEEATIRPQLPSTVFTATFAPAPPPVVRNPGLVQSATPAIVGRVR